jgi:hypothetical protein
LANLVGGLAEFSGEMKGKYGIIHKQAFIRYRGKEGRLVWDYILLNELTFEDAETGEQFSLGVSTSDKKTGEIFNDLVSRCGI